VALTLGLGLALQATTHHEKRLSPLKPAEFFFISIGYSICEEDILMTPSTPSFQLSKEKLPPAEFSFEVSRGQPWSYRY
jgi:hypothetical protein